jgi:uncharacterized membrane protein AbrB (regulator of aidB expression)
MWQAWKRIMKDLLEAFPFVLFMCLVAVCLSLFIMWTFDRFGAWSLLATVPVSVVLLSASTAFGLAVAEWFWDRGDR